MKAVLKIEILRDSNGKQFYAVRLPILGLTAYGNTKQESVDKLKRMTSAFIDAHYKMSLEDFISGMKEYK